MLYRRGLLSFGVIVCLMLVLSSCASFTPNYGHEMVAVPKDQISNPVINSLHSPEMNAAIAAARK